jgi:hypothetical protein
VGAPNWAMCQPGIANDEIEHDLVPSYPYAESRAENGVRCTCQLGHRVEGGSVAKQACRTRLAQYALPECARVDGRGSGRH